MTRDSILGEISCEDFLAKYWQKKPLLIRQAIKDFHPPIDADQLAGLSLEEEVESRLVIGNSYKVEQGPFSEQRYTELGDHNWTLLVQAVNLWLPEVAELLDYFNFLPAWRIDDIMVSFAADGGSVGPHYDNYDVFLLQGEGRRKWSVGNSCDADSPLIEHSDLRILENYNFDHEWVLEPGDMLYLPPKLAHHGIAVGPCTTFSIGFRAPSAAEVLDDLATELISQNKLTGYLIDPPLEPEMAKQPIPSAYVEQVRALLSQALNDDETLMHWLAQYMTRPKYPHLTDITGETREATIQIPDNSRTINYKNGEPR